MQDTKLGKLLHILSDGKLHSGAQLGEELGVTRSAVWKFIRQLKEMTGLEVEAKTNQGYCLSEKIQLLDLYKIKAYLSQRYHPYLDKTIIFDEIPSTNSYLLEQAQKQNEAVYICLAEMQTAGRGRFNRHWISPFGNNIYLSLLWKFTQDLTQLSGLSLVIAVSVVRALKKYGIKEEITVKWPNDIFWEGQKLGGVLIDLRGESNYQCDAVIGVGLNIFMPERLRQADTLLVDLVDITHEVVNRNKMVGLLLEEMLDGLALFQTQGLKPFLKEFKKFDATFDKLVTVSQGNHVVEGIGKGVDEQGYFLLQDTNNHIHRFLCGEASLRGRV